MLLNMIKKLFAPQEMSANGASAAINSVDSVSFDSYSSVASKDDIYYCFRLLLGRNPSKEEWTGHSNALEGQAIKDVMLSYLTSTEFKNRSLGVVDVDNIKLIELDGYSMYVPANDPHVGNPIAKNGVYEPHITNFVKANLSEGDIFFDIGANIGYFTFLASSIVGEHGKVYSFEPFSENIKMLSINNMESKLDNINIYPFAVSNSDNLCLFDNSGSNGFIRPMSDKLSRVMDSTPVYSVALDRLLGNVDKVDFIKIDTEGAEYLALSGAKEILVKHTPTIVSEFSPEALLATSGVNYDEYLKLLLINEKYQLYAFEGHKLIACGRNFDQLMAVFTRSNAEHIDIVASPNQLK